MPIKKPMLIEDLLVSVVDYLPFQTVYGMSRFLLSQINAMENLRLTSKQAFADNMHLYLSLKESLNLEREINDHDEIDGKIAFDLASCFPYFRKLALRVPSAHLMDSLSFSKFTQITSLTYDTGLGDQYPFYENDAWLQYLPKLIHLRHFALATYHGFVLLESIKALTPNIEHISLTSRYYDSNLDLLFFEITQILINNVIALKSLKLDIADMTASFAINLSHLTQLLKLKKKSRFFSSVTLGGRFPGAVLGWGLDTLEKECRKITRMIPLEVYWTKIPTAVNLLSLPGLTRLKIKLLAINMSPYFFNYFTIDELLVFLQAIEDNVRESPAIQLISRKEIEKFVSHQTLYKLEIFSKIKVFEALLQFKNNCRGFISRVEMMLFLQNYSHCLVDVRISSRDLLIFFCQNYMEFTFEQLKSILLLTPAPTDLFYKFVKYTSVLILLIDEHNTSLERFPEGMLVFDNVIAYVAKKTDKQIDALFLSLDRIADLLTCKDVLFSHILKLLNFENFENIIFELLHLLKAGCEMSWIENLHQDYISVERIMQLLFYQFYYFCHPDELVYYMGTYTMRDIIAYAYSLYSEDHDYDGTKIEEESYIFTPMQVQERLHQLGIKIPSDINSVTLHNRHFYEELRDGIRFCLDRLPYLFSNSTQNSPAPNPYAGQVAGADAQQQPMYPSHSSNVCSANSGGLFSVRDSSEGQPPTPSSQQYLYM